MINPNKLKRIIGSIEEKLKVELLDNDNHIVETLISEEEATIALYLKNSIKYKLTSQQFDKLMLLINDFEKATARKAINDHLKMLNS